ncbi:hypothetical protein K4K57_006508 [Colletotrichum sp. SAR 10_99]|nr:hypothetical protein K4K55_003659 [Colletotrichum sp. SAR 10_96]KAJ5010909.1 hypothetical protein K4K57_006508 [Colletotrichum sp. SAR 10_99]
MAGPGGGPPRRSHTKSRKGCDTCKRRHIRCDENFPQCRNCTKHKIRCPYNDMPIPEDRSTTPDKPDLMWTPEIEAAIAQWQRTGIFPFPNLGIYPEPNPQRYSVEDLRLIYHVAKICDELAVFDYNGFTIWTRQMPTIIKIGVTHSYVMHALLGFAAMHIAFLTDCPLVGNMGTEHRGLAMNGLQEAISTFGHETSDAVLAASLVLSWQATDWKSWTQLMQGTSSVIEAMDPWKHTSQFGDFIAESCTFPTAPGSPSPDHKPSQPRKEDTEAFTKTLQQLQKLEIHLKHNKEESHVKMIQQLVSFVKGARKFNTGLSICQQFERLSPLRNWLFWLPVMLLKQTGGSPTALVVIAHFYTVALVTERLFPDIGAAYFGSLSIGPVEEIARRLLSINISGTVDGDLQTPLTLMEFPIDTVNEFRHRMGWTQPARTPSFPQFNPPNFYLNEPVPLPPVTDSYMPYGTQAFSYSTESLMMPETAAAPPNNMSPLVLSSPFVHSQYLNIPSPNYGGYSPASSTFEGSIVYSDNEDYGYEQRFDMSGMPAVNNQLGVGMPTTPTYPPPEDQHLLASSSHTVPPSPFLNPEQFGMLPLPESPVPPNLPLRHRHTPSSSVTESPRSVSAPFPPRNQWLGSTPTVHIKSEKGKEREL